MQIKISEREHEIALLRQGNSAKGNQGELLIQNLLRSTFQEYEIIDTSNRPHATDIEMNSGEGSRIIFEVKSKKIVERRDITKFMNDIRTLQTDHNAIHGAVFVSTQSQNIPGKGSISMEFSDDHKYCVLFLGFENDTECKSHLTGHIRLFLSICRVLRDTKECDSESSNVLKERLTACMDDIRVCYESLHKQRTYVKQFTTGMTEEIRRMLERLQVRIDSVSGGQSTESMCKQATKRKRK